MEEEIEGPRREAAPVRLKCESQQGVSSLRSVWRMCVRVFAYLVLCHKVQATVTIWDPQRMCGPYLLTTCLIHN